MLIAQMLVLLHSALVKQHRFWITSLLYFILNIFSPDLKALSNICTLGLVGNMERFPAEQGLRGAGSLSAYLPSFSSVSLHFLLPLPLLALTDYNLNLLPGRDSLGNNTKSLCGKLCDFTTNFNHSRHYFSSWWKAEESDVTGRKSGDWLGGWRASNAGLQAQTTTFCSAFDCLSHFPWYTSHFKICNMVQVSKRSLGWIISCTHITLSFGKYTKWSSQEKSQNKLE